MSLASSFLILLLRLLNHLIYPLLLRFAEKKRQSVPPLTDDVLKISATKLSALIRQKKIPSEAIVRAYIKRIKEVNHLINAVVEERFEDALKEAKSVDDYLRTTSLTENELQKIKPLLGVPVTIKESCKLSGMSYAVGSVVRKGFKADTDGDAVIRVKMSGAIPLLVSNTSELCMSICCQNYVTGITCCPYDITKNSGASSGGEAALLGSGASLIGLGSDICGSIRFPAMCCGVFGHKPTARTVPLKGHFPLPSDKRTPDYLVIGPMARYAEDLKLFMTVLSGKQAITDLNLQEKVDLSKLRVYYMEEAPPSFVNPAVDPEIKNAIRVSAKYLEENCNTNIVEESNIAKCFQNTFDMPLSLIAHLEGTPKLLKAENQNAITELIKTFGGQSKFSPGYLFSAAMALFKGFIHDDNFENLNNEIKKKLASELSDDGVLLYPTFISTAPPHKGVFLKFTGSMYLAPFNTLGFPSTQIPCGLSSEGLPIGIQVIAAPNKDRLCFAVAEELEKCFGGWVQPNNSIKVK